MGQQRAVVVGAGIGGLTAAMLLAHRGFAVTVIERAARPGGKMRELLADGRPVDAGPTVFTLRSIFDEVFAQLGERLDDHVSLRQAEVLARHAWNEGPRLDLFADKARSADAIATFAGAADGANYLAFCAEAAAVFKALDRPFMRQGAPSMAGLIRGTGWRNLGQLTRIQPFQTLWSRMSRRFVDPRLRQLFARYATYCGSSPFLAPATLMLVAHVEQEGVWLVEGGMHRLAVAMEKLAIAQGAEVRYGAHAASLIVEHGAARGVRLTDGEIVPADAVLFNGDMSALGSGQMGDAAARAVPQVRPAERSLSAVTWTLAAQVRGWPLARHTVLFGGDYRREFDQIVAHRHLPGDPTVYVCAQDRDDTGTVQCDGPERLLCLVNAPASGDTHGFGPQEIAECARAATATLARAGLTMDRPLETGTCTTPTDFHHLFPATGGALYGRASHGWTASFRRAGVATRLPGLYLAGGSIHPGPGIPMAALSGLMAAQRIIQDRASMQPSRRTGTTGGMSMA
jgi:1-hydroxycarotenoid 3,4-desaturase